MVISTCDSFRRKYGFGAPVEAQIVCTELCLYCDEVMRFGAVCWSMGVRWDGVRE